MRAIQPAELSGEQLCDLCDAALRGSEQAVLTTIHLSAPNALGLIGLLQVALRHPALKQDQSVGAAVLARKLLYELELALRPLGPHVAELIRRGWLAVHDAPLEPKS